MQFCEMRERKSLQMQALAICVLFALSVAFGRYQIGRDSNTSPFITHYEPFHGVMAQRVLDYTDEIP